MKKFACAIIVLSVIVLSALSTAAFAGLRVMPLALTYAIGKCDCEPNVLEVSSELGASLNLVKNGLALALGDMAKEVKPVGRQDYAGIKVVLNDGASEMIVRDKINAFMGYLMVRAAGVASIMSISKTDDRGEVFYVHTIDGEPDWLAVHFGLPASPQKFEESLSWVLGPMATKIAVMDNVPGDLYVMVALEEGVDYYDAMDKVISWVDYLSTVSHKIVM